MGRASWLKPEAGVGSADLKLALLCWSEGIGFLKDSYRGIFIWVSEGEAGGIVGGY